MSKRPLIGVTLDSEQPGGYSKYPWYAIRQNYAEAITSAGGLPVALPHDPALAAEYLNRIDALVVTGLYLALANPITFLCLLALFVALLVWLLPKLVRLALLPFRRLMAEKPMASKKRA